MPSNERKELITTIEKCEALALGRRWRRLIYKPLQYIKAIGSRSFFKPFFKDGIDTKATLFFGGEMAIRLPAATDIYLTGCKSHPSEIRLAKWMINHILPGWTVIDIGAHFGYYTLLLQHLTGAKGKVAAFEPSPLAYEKLRLNISPFKNVQAYNLGVSRVTGKQLLAVRGVLASESNSFFDIAGANTILAPTVSLNDWIQQNGLIPQFIKADVEGGEWQMIQGASALLLLYHPIIAMEIRTVYFEMAYYPAIEWLKTNGYKMYSLATDGTLLHCTDAWSYMQSNNIDSDNFLFMPVKSGGN